MSIIYRKIISKEMNKIFLSKRNNTINCRNYTNNTFNFNNYTIAFNYNVYNSNINKFVHKRISSESSSNKTKKNNPNYGNQTYKNLTKKSSLIKYRKPFHKRILTQVIKVSGAKNNNENNNLKSLKLKILTNVLKFRNQDNNNNNFKVKKNIYKTNSVFITDFSNIYQNNGKNIKKEIFQNCKNKTKSKSKSRSKSKKSGKYLQNQNMNLFKKYKKINQYLSNKKFNCLTPKLSFNSFENYYSYNETLANAKKLKTLVIDLDETLVHSKIDPFTDGKSDIILEIKDSENENKMIHVLIRPGVENFLKKMSEFYELAVFTASLSVYADKLLDVLDKQKKFICRLFREHCTYIHSVFVKDLGKLGREMKDIIILDNSPVSYTLNKKNGIPIKSWTGNKNDTELEKIQPVLEFLSKVYDVRDYIPKIVYKDKINYAKFKEIKENFIIKTEGNIHEQSDLKEKIADTQKYLNEIKALNQKGNKNKLKSYGKNQKFNTLGNEVNKINSYNKKTNNYYIKSKRVFDCDKILNKVKNIRIKTLENESQIQHFCRNNDKKYCILEHKKYNSSENFGSFDNAQNISNNLKTIQSNQRTVLKDVLRKRLVQIIKMFRDKNNNIPTVKKHSKSPNKRKNNLKIKITDGSNNNYAQKNINTTTNKNPYSYIQNILNINMKIKNNDNLMKMNTTTSKNNISIRKNIQINKKIYNGKRIINKRNVVKSGRIKNQINSSINADPSSSEWVVDSKEIYHKSSNSNIGKSAIKKFTKPRELEVKKNNQTSNGLI